MGLGCEVLYEGQNEVAEGQNEVAEVLQMQIKKSPIDASPRRLKLSGTRHYRVPLIEGIRTVCPL